MSLLDKNKVFFGLIHYILSEQRNVNWIIKSSLIDFTGISSYLNEKTFKTDNILNDIIDYMKEIKPYHTQFSKYFEKYVTKTEIANVSPIDTFNQTIKLKFDKIKSISDIIDIFSYITDKNLLENPEEFNTDIYNISNLQILSTYDMNIYFRTQTYSSELNKQIWVWIKKYENLPEGYYYNNISNDYYKFEKDLKNNLNEKYNNFKVLNNNEIKSFCNLHEANRLFYLGLKDNEEIRKEINANFKGLEITGGNFNIEQFGYDIYNYDTTDYDSPTIIYDYCFIDKRETFPLELSEIKNYEKSFVLPSKHLFLISNDFILNNTNESLLIYLKKNNTLEQIKDYEIIQNNENTYLDIFDDIGIKNTLYIVKTIENNSQIEYSNCQIFSSFPFKESESDVIIRKYIEIKEDGSFEPLEIPKSENNLNMSVQIKYDSTGQRKPYLNYTKNENTIIINNYNDISEYDHIIITAFDYKYLYDKIYTWEDKFGRKNNEINLSGDNFLRPIYEKDRPSELIVSQPISDLTIYKKYSNNNTINIIKNDFKNQMLYNDFDSSLLPKIKNLIYEDNDTKLIISEIELDNTNNLLPAPNKVLIDSEIIEYSEIDYNNNSIKKLKRGLNGSPLLINMMDKFYPNIHTLKIGDIVIPFNGFSEYERNNKYISHLIKDTNIKSYYLPYNSNFNSTLSVYYFNKINLLENVYYTSSEIKVDYPNLFSDKTILNNLLNDTNKTIYNGDFKLFINNDIINFKSIYKNNNSEYIIKDFELPKKYSNYTNEIYSTESTYIGSILPFELSSDNYSIDYSHGNIKYKLLKQSKYDDNNNLYYVYSNDLSVLYKIIGNENNSKLSGTIYSTSNNIIGKISDDIIYNNDGNINGLIIDNYFTDSILSLNLKNIELNKYDRLLINSY